MWALATHSGYTRRSTSHAEPSKAPPKVTGAVATSPMTQIQCAAWFQKSLDSCEWTGWSCRSSLTKWRLPQDLGCVIVQRRTIRELHGSVVIANSDLE